MSKDRENLSIYPPPLSENPTNCTTPPTFRRRDEIQNYFDPAPRMREAFGKRLDLEREKAVGRARPRGARSRRKSRSVWRIPPGAFTQDTQSGCKERAFSDAPQGCQAAEGGPLRPSSLAHRGADVLGRRICRRRWVSPPSQRRQLAREIKEMAEMYRSQLGTVSAGDLCMHSRSSRSKSGWKFGTALSRWTAPHPFTTPKPGRRAPRGLR